MLKKTKSYPVFPLIASNSKKSPGLWERNNFIVTVSSPQLQIPETRDSEYKVMHSTNTLEAHDSSG